MFFPVGRWRNSGAVKLACFEPSGFSLRAYMVDIFQASSLMDVNKCVTKSSQGDTEVLPLNSWEPGGTFPLCSGAQSRVPEATGDLGWKVRMVRSDAGSPARSPSVMATVRRIREGSLPKEGALLRVRYLWRSTARMPLSRFWTLACLSCGSAALLAMGKCRQSLAGTLTASPEPGGFTGELGKSA